MTLPQKNDSCTYAKHALEVWAIWLLSSDERGWPRFSSEVQAQYRAQTQTVTNGVAAYRGRVEVGDQGRTVPREPPAMPKETRPASGCRVPDIDQARLGPWVDRHLRDLMEFNRTAAMVLQAHHLLLSLSAKERADGLGLPLRRYWERYNSGLMWLQGRLSAP